MPLPTFTAESGLQSLQRLLLDLGTPGLFVLSSIDSAGIPTGGAPDIALVLLAPDLTWAEVAIHVLATVLGSTTGCVVLYAIGRRGIQLLLSRGSPRCYKNAIKNFRSLGHWAVFGGVLGPPPFPTKAIVLAAGGVESSWQGFVIAVVAGRLIRYSIAGVFGKLYGDAAIDIAQDHYILAFLVVAVVLAVGYHLSTRGSLNDESDPE